MESYSHHRGPLDVVSFGQCKPPAAEIDVPDNDMDPMVTMVPVRGGRAAPHVKAVISVNPVADASAPVWAAAARGPAWSAADAFTPVRAASTTPLGMRSCPLRRLLPRCLPH
jgi:hypothetical protein